MESSRWFEVENVEEIPSPGLLVYHHRVEENIRRMVEIAGDACRLRPHIKTHKMGEILRMQDNFGITKCKCSNIAEAELAAMTGVKDILLAMQPVGPNLNRLFQLKKAYPYASFAAIADSPEVIRLISETAIAFDSDIDLFLDLNTGMNRTGVLPDAQAVELYKLISDLPKLRPAGLHAYDGHINDSSSAERKINCDKAFEPVTDLQTALQKQILPVPLIITSGSPTFPFHASRKGNIELSPGTTLLWDYGYSQQYPDLNFLYAALMLTRVVSKPGPGLLCLDLGHKAIASEMPHPRVKLIGLDNYSVKMHSEEHLVIESDEAGKYIVGDQFYGIPWHICPTVSRYNSAFVIRESRAAAEWKIEARGWKINIFS
jgi:D-serine deaminase-like pyridoxal phosphate-dependent protein